MASYLTGLNPSLTYNTKVIVNARGQNPHLVIGTRKLSGNQGRVLMGVPAVPFMQNPDGSYRRLDEPSKRTPRQGYREVPQGRLSR